ncbi:hypothetical protein DY000_02030035 [Brassica cretica]|uniref:ABC transmembrane type-1 domain-containing protein n=1 Tax=Brassica cretica TaxID=69181 RepID=A0ABQ7DJF5_BRACR|nr:hypothetical protein DY000_02030035 [Brassica cretica]
MLLTSCLRLQDLFQQGISAADLRGGGRRISLLLGRMVSFVVETRRRVLLMLIAALLVVPRLITTPLVVGI